MRDLESDFGHAAERAVPSAAESPEQIYMLVVRCLQYFSSGSDDFKSKNLIKSHSKARGECRVASTQSESRDAHRSIAASRNNQPQR